MVKCAESGIQTDERDGRATSNEGSSSEPRKCEEEDIDDPVGTVLLRDPATRTRSEAFFFTPGVRAIQFHRAAHKLYCKERYFLARMVSHVSRLLTGIEIHPGAKIGKNFFIDHGMGIVIGETTVIGDNVSMFQGVTLGGVGTESIKRHPTIGNNVVIGAGAKVLGNITIGDNVRIGAGSVVVTSVPPNSTVVGVPGRVVKREGKYIGIDLHHEKIPDPLTRILEEMCHEIGEVKYEVEKLKKDIDNRLGDSKDKKSEDDTKDGGV